MTCQYDLSHWTGQLLLGGNLLATGIFIGGIMTIITTTTCMRLGGDSSAGTVTGFIDGVASLGAAFAQVLVSYLAGSSGWESVFQYMSILAASCTIPLGLSLL